MKRIPHLICIILFFESDNCFCNSCSIRVDFPYSGLPPDENKTEPGIISAPQHSVDFCNSCIKRFCRRRFHFLNFSGFLLSSVFPDVFPPLFPVFYCYFRKKQFQFPAGRTSSAPFCLFMSAYIADKYSFYFFFIGIYVLLEVYKFPLQKTRYAYGGITSSCPLRFRIRVSGGIMSVLFFPFFFISIRSFIPALKLPVQPGIQEVSPLWYELSKI